MESKKEKTQMNLFPRLRDTERKLTVTRKERR